MKQRILLISPQPFFQWRGSPIRVKFNLMALTQLGYSVDLLTLPIGDEHPIDGVKVYRVANPFKIKNIPIGPSGWKVFFDILLFFYGIYLCRKYRYDVIHGIEEAGILVVTLAKIFRSRPIFEKHSDPSSYKKGKLKNFLLRSYARVEKTTVNMADAVICTGPGLVDQVDAMNTQTQAFNIFDIPSSLMEPTSDDSHKVRKTLIQKTDEVLITYVGSFAVYQGVDLLFSAIPAVVQQAQHARFVIIGGNASEIESFSKILENQGVAENVSFVGKVDPDILPRYLGASDILLSPRASGVNTPLKILDYLKAGKAIVATDHPANRRLLDEQSAVLAVSEKKSFAAAIVALVKDANSRTRLGSNCRKMYEEKFTFEHHCQRLAACYDHVLQGKASSAT